MNEKLPNHSSTPDWYREVLVVSDEPVAFAIGRFSLPPSVKMHQAAPKESREPSSSFAPIRSGQWNLQAEVRACPVPSCSC